jgi:hypothetical protein
MEKILVLSFRPVLGSLWHRFGAPPKTRRPRTIKQPGGKELVLNFHLTYSSLFWLALLYLPFSLLFAVIVGRFIRFGVGLDQERSLVGSFIVPEGSSRSTPAPASYEDDRNEL